ncbi:alpha/beta hydrolase [Saccharibacillus sp. CPCC 101409]|uniref:alpha/beta fold hydrolase n=1 Tax=Saccharibacillus sp. CPCC 101409 TaxID=3058041 RepID=UPI002671DB78|nr:alpha/beta hydrolase [Saccharibacillus sp. CPCC 101409]MDO3412600.1 alpha/beta hydrolase [Saccharibacillus sp. CPCC 101409]
MSVTYKFVEVDGLNIFYREAGSRENPTLLLLHGFPSSSHMYRNLIARLEDRYHIVAPDYPGFGNSDQPPMSEFEYTFDNLAALIDRFTQRLELDRYSIYVHDYGAPVGFRLAAAHPERIQAIISQNGNAYEEGLEPSWAPVRALWEDPDSESNRAGILDMLTPDFTKYQYVDGTRNPQVVSPDSWNMDQIALDRPGNAEIQLALFYDYRNNLKRYPAWHEYFRTFQPPLLAAWGKNDMFFGPAGALAYQKDLKDAEVHLLNTGHFPLEEELELSAELIRRFLSARSIG